MKQSCSETGVHVTPEDPAANRVFRFNEVDFYLFGLSAGLRSLLGNGLSLGFRKTIGKISQPINSYTRFPEYHYMELAIRGYLQRHRSLEQVRILDVGSPKCFGLFLANAFDANIDLTDLNHATLQEYEVMWKQISSSAKGRAAFAAQDARSLNYKDSTFDIVYSMSVIEHVEGPSGDSVCIAEMVRVLKPGGLLVISVPFGSKYVVQQRRGFAYEMGKTRSDSLFFFQRVYNEAALKSRIIPPLTGLHVQSQWTIWRNIVLPIQIFKKLGESIQGLLGFLNPVFSIWGNRCASGILTKIPGCYGEIHSPADSYGDVVIVAEKPEQWPGESVHDTV